MSPEREPATLERELVVVIPVLGGSPQSRADCLPLFSACSFAVESHTLVVESHVVEIDVAARQNLNGWTA